MNQEKEIWRVRLWYRDLVVVVIVEKTRCFIVGVMWNRRGWKDTEKLIER